VSKRNKRILSGTEREYLNAWLLRYGKVKVRKYQRLPEVILNTYLAGLVKFNKSFPENNDGHRLAAIKDYIDYVLNVEPRYKWILKLHNLKGYEFGLMLGYKNSGTWHSSYKRYVYIRALVRLVNMHEELLNRLNNPGQ
jgi:hypothetical protein